MTGAAGANRLLLLGLAAVAQQIARGAGRNLLRKGSRPGSGLLAQGSSPGGGLLSPGSQPGGGLLSRGSPAGTTLLTAYTKWG